MATSRRATDEARSPSRGDTIPREERAPARLAPSDTRWLLLIHQIPPKPDYLRVKIGRRLQRVGSVALKKTVYVLPKSEASAEDFEWIRREITDAGGDAAVIEAAMVAGVSDTEIEQLFRRARDEDYSALAEDAQAVAGRIAQGAEPRTVGADVTRLERRYDEV